MLNDFLEPTPFIDNKAFKHYQYAQLIAQYQHQKIDFRNVEIAVLGWNYTHYSNFQEALYQLSYNFKQGKVVDLGMIKSNPIHLIEVVDCLLQNNVLPIIISPSSAAIPAQLKAYEQRYELLNLALLDSRVPFETTNEENKTTLINQLLTYYPQLLLHLSCIGYQSYLIDQTAVDFLEDKYFELHRLGKVQHKLEEIEPMVRDADLAAFSINAIRSADAPATSYTNPNGFLAAEACQIVRYLTMSDRLSSLCIHGFDTTIDDRGQTANMIAQLVWFAIEGFFARTHEYPVEVQNLRAYLVDNTNIDSAITFYKSTKSDRWWFEVPKNLYPKHQLIACSYADYKTACDGELPDRLFNAIQRLS